MALSRVCFTLWSIFTPWFFTLALQCGDVSFNSSLHTCLTSIDGEPVLCPVLAGEQFMLCGAGCYSKRTYSCINGVQAPLPPPPGPFTVTASRPGAPFDGLPFQAASRHFRLGLDRPSTYCPFQRGPCQHAAKTTFRNGELVVRVPGGQQTYIESSGAFAFTSPHSDDVPNYYSLETTAYDGAHGGGFFGPHGASWLACPVDNTTTLWQIFAKLPGVNPAVASSNMSRPLSANITNGAGADFSNTTRDGTVTGPCTEFVALVNGQDETLADAWQYE